MDELERDLLERASRCHSPTKRSLPLRCFQMGATAVNRTRPCKVHSYKHQIPTWKL
ncbi:hypothetical protein Peur_053917 [Populus x canadensis]